MVRLVILRLLESYFRHRWLYLIPIAALVALGAYFSLTARLKYSTSGTLYVERDSLLASLTATNFEGAWWSTPAQNTISEINELLATKSFARSVIQRTNLEARMGGSPEEIDEVFNELRTMIWLLPQGEKLVQIGAVSEDPRLPQQVGNAVLEGYVQWKINSDYQESLAAQNFFANQIKPYEEEEQRARDALLEFLQIYPDPVRGDRPTEEVMELERLTTVVKEAEDRVKVAFNNEESARLSLAKSESVTRQTYQVIDAPEPPREPQRSRREMAVSLLVYFAIGAAISVAAVLLNALFDRTFRFVVDIRHGLSLPVLAAVPTDKPGIRTMTRNSEPARAEHKSDSSTTLAPTVPELQP